MRLLPALAVMILFSPADSARAGGDGRVMEIVTFRLVAGATEADFLAAAAGTEDPLRSQNGFLGRTLTRSDAGVWTDHVLWSSTAAAMTGADAMMANPAFGPFMALIDGQTVEMRHDPVLWQMD
ncbi:hypothetical protein [Tabrizicola sp.]|uniref:antibiotic biosynthesis monooxygenase family protein n=1 Tax=Tabrizicola sp. TaxID=2005166 RepID=UPI002616A6FF|nr:hypothetical protein [Tabrizicola sp.]MDM7930318.1 hypothetical protein [Tabrizicola sp.]